MKSIQDVELLSVYLDGRLSPSGAQRARLETRLSSDASLRAVMDDLRAARGLLRQLPQRRAPRNFTLAPKMAGIRPPEPRAYPTLRFASALTAFLFIATFAINGFFPRANSNFTAPSAPAFGMGGAAGPAPLENPSATQAPIQPLAVMAPTETTPAADQSLAPTESPTEAPYAKSLAPESGNGEPARVPNEAPVPFVWQIGLGIIAILLGVSAWFIRRASESKFRKQWK